MRKLQDPRFPASTWALASALFLFAFAAFVSFVINPGGFEGQIAWAWALMPGLPVGTIVADRFSKIWPNAEPLFYWSLAIGVTLIWYFALSYSAITILRSCGRAASRS
jgi:hypothetical protein